MKLKFKKNITVTFACIMNELFICAILMVIIWGILGEYELDEVTHILEVLLIVAVILNALLIVISLIARAFTKTSYEIEDNILTIKPEYNEDKVIDLNSILLVIYDFGTLGGRGHNPEPSALILHDDKDNMVLSLNNPPIAMVHLVKKHCKNAKVRHVNSHRFIVELVVFIIVAILKTL